MPTANKWFEIPAYFEREHEQFPKFQRALIETNTPHYFQRLPPSEDMEEEHFMKYCSLWISPDSISEVSRLILFLYYDNVESGENSAGPTCPACDAPAHDLTECSSCGLTLRRTIDDTTDPLYRFAASYCDF